MYVYGGPGSQTVTDGWGGTRYLWHQMMANSGYLVASVDNRGTPAPRGRAWRKVVYGDVGTLAAADQAAAVRAIAAQRDWVGGAQGSGVGSRLLIEYLESR